MGDCTEGSNPSLSEGFGRIAKNPPALTIAEGFEPSERGQDAWASSKRSLRPARRPIAEHDVRRQRTRRPVETRHDVEFRRANPSLSEGRTGMCRLSNKVSICEAIFG